MANTVQKDEPTAPPAVTRADQFAGILGACRLIIFLCALGIPPLSQAADSYSTIVSNHLALETEPSIAAEHNPETNKVENPQISDLKRAVLAEVQMQSQKAQAAPPPPKSDSGVARTLGVALAALLSLGAPVYLVKRKLDSLISARAAIEHRSRALVAEDPSVAVFFRELRAHLTAPVASAGDRLNEVQAQTSESKPDAAPDPLQEFFALVPGQITSLRKLFSEISRAADPAARQKVLLEFFNQVSALKERSRPSELRPAWLMACALDGLLKQLSSDTAEVTPSVLGTVASAVDLLETLCVPGLNPDLATVPPVRLLAVDDDPVSRLAISFALKKAFNAPDLAPDGETALGLVARQNYDVIFLDVDMPGMDGFEVCTEIHRTKGHETTPVVFVTRHSDFHSRAKSTLSGGEDLIAKPFLAFEITVKALTLTLRRRLESTKPARGVNGQPAVSAALAGASEPNAVVAQAALHPHEVPTAQTEERNQRECQSSGAGDPPLNEKASWEISDRGFQALFNGSRDDSTDAFFSQAPAYLEAFRHEMLAVQQANEPAKLQAFLCRLCAGIHSLASEAERAERRTLSRLSCALEGMLKKMSAHTKLCTPSTFIAATAALELLEELCGHTEANLDLSQPVRILVVDDDPVARRAVSMSIQLVFGRPDNADSGEAAVGVATEKSFDLIFLDVLMPGIDGFAACKKIRETGLNRETPVVFITSHDDTEARSKAIASGGCGFIPKPVLSSQITLTALTFILRARLGKADAPSATEPAACLEMA